MPILAIRSLVFNISFILVTLVLILFTISFYFFLPRRKAWYIVRFWIKSCLWLAKYMAGIDCRIEGQENIVPGACIIAAKHQSVWETLALLLYFSDPVLILKRELMYIPLFGWYMAKVGVIAINRGAPLKAMKAVIKGAKEKIGEGRQILIFPEGTRRIPGSAPDYKPGVAALYGELGVPVVMVAHNAGLYWPRDTFQRYKGIIRVRILPPLAPGLARKEFIRQLIEKTEKSCDDLLLEAVRSKPLPALPELTVKRLGELGVTWAGPVR